MLMLTRTRARFGRAPLVARLASQRPAHFQLLEVPTQRACRALHTANETLSRHPRHILLVSELRQRDQHDLRANRDPTNPIQRPSDTVDAHNESPPRPAQTRQRNIRHRRLAIRINSPVHRLDVRRIKQNSPRRRHHMPNTPRLRPPPQSVRRNTCKLGSFAGCEQGWHFLHIHKDIVQCAVCAVKCNMCSVCTLLQILATLAL